MFHIEPNMQSGTQRQWEKWKSMVSVERTEALWVLSHT